MASGGETLRKLLAQAAGVGENQGGPLTPSQPAPSALRLSPTPGRGEPKGPQLPLPLREGEGRGRGETREQPRPLRLPLSPTPGRGVPEGPEAPLPPPSGGRGDGGCAEGSAIFGASRQVGK